MEQVEYEMEKTIIVDTELGKVQGYSRRGIVKFKGIPYASPPVGELRFSPPIPREPWDGVLDATKYGPIAPQPYSPFFGLFGEPRKQSEADCLTLNVWTPTTAEYKRPVMVWIHGGGFFGGSGSDIDGARLALRGNVVIVSINYRLGPLGFLYLPGGSANVGMLDQITALKWVKNNIRAFGGDPQNVTIFGESAGGTSVCTLMVMPAAKGLFHHAIAQSAVCNPLSYRISTNKEAYKGLVAKLALKKGDINELRKLPVDKLIEADPTMHAIDSGLFYSSGKITPRLGPVIDENTLLEHPLNAIRNGKANDIEFLIGTNLDETKLWSALNPRLKEIDENRMLKRISGLMNVLGQDENKADQIIKIYKNAKENKISINPQEIVHACTTDFMFRIPAIRLAEAQNLHQPNTYMYLFTWKSPFYGGSLGAAHSLEIPFVFGLLGEKEIGIFPSKNEETEAISHKMMDSWITFAWTGNPINDNIPEWPSYEINKRSTMLFGKEVKMVNGPFDKERAAWDGIL